MKKLDVKKVSTILLVGLLATTGCGGGASSWQDEMAKAVQQMESEGVAAEALPASGTSTEEIEASVDELCTSLDGGAVPSDQLAAIPAIAMIGLRQSGATNDTLKTFGKALDGGMEDKCPAAHEDLFGAGPITSWEQAASCEGDATQLLADPAGALASMCPN